jgi:cell division protein FtsB
MKKNLDGFIEKATENIVEDRAATKTLLLNLMQYIQTGDDKHREFGLIAAKYLETLQRSNEQLVKLASLLQKQQRGEEGISEKDRQDLFDMINSSEEDD